MLSYNTTRKTPPAHYADLGDIPEMQTAQDEAHEKLAALRAELKVAEAALVAVETDDETPLAELGRLRQDAREAITAGAERVNRAEKRCQQAAHLAGQANTAAMSSDAGTKRRRALVDGRAAKVAAIRAAAAELLDQILDLSADDKAVEQGLDAERRSLGANITSSNLNVGSPATQARSAVLAAVDSLGPLPPATRHAIARALVGDDTDAQLKNWTWTVSELDAETANLLRGMVPAAVWRRWVEGDPKPAQRPGHRKSSRKPKAAGVNPSPKNDPAPQGAA